jgi:hypothetical protein
MHNRFAPHLASVRPGLPFTAADGQEPGDANCDKPPDLASPDFGQSTQPNEIEEFTSREIQIETSTVDASSRVRSVAGHALFPWWPPGRPLARLCQDRSTLISCTLPLPPTLLVNAK